MTTARFPGYLEQVLAVLEAAGYEAYVVGGAVRDLLLGKEPGDFDVTTKARPEEVCAVARRAGWTVVDKLGQNLGVVVVVVDGHSVEVATFRGERYGVGAHRPDAVWYCDCLEDDLSRRDFTVNAMAMDRMGTVYDFYGGRDDLARRILRTVGDPRRRYGEDALRMYRACRFVAQLGFTYVEGDDTPDDVQWDFDAGQSLEANLERGAAEARAWKREHGTPWGFGMAGTPYFLKKRYRFETERCRGLSLERVRAEMEKMLTAPYAGKGLQLWMATGLADAECRLRRNGNEVFVPVLPELRHLVALHQNTRFHCFDAWEHTLLAVDNGPRDLLLRWALLLHDVAKGLPGVRGVHQDGQPSDHGHEKQSADMAREILSRWQYGPDFVERAVWLVANHMRFAPMLITKRNGIARWVRGEALAGPFRREAELAEGFRQVSDVFLADMGATWAGVRQDPVLAEGRALVEEVMRMAGMEMPVHTSDLKLSGRAVQDILRDRDGLCVGDALRYLLRRVQNGSVPNDAGALARALRRKLERHGTEAAGVSGREEKKGKNRED